MTDYFMGKKKWGKPIAAQMLAIITRATENGQRFRGYVEPFFGMGHVAYHLLPQLQPDLPVVASDVNSALIRFWQAMQSGALRPPPDVSRERVLALRETRDRETPLHILVGYGCSFMGRYFDGVRPERYARNRESLLRVAGVLGDRTPPVRFLAADFFRLPVPRAAIVYMDPPYLNASQSTLRRFGHCDDFDTNAFWRRATQWADPATGNLVFVSERNAPAGWVVVWEQVYNIQHSGWVNNGIAQRAERLYCLRSALARFGVGRLNRS